MEIKLSQQIIHILQFDNTEQSLFLFFYTIIQILPFPQHNSREKRVTHCGRFPSKKNLHVCISTPNNNTQTQLNKRKLH